MSVTPAGAAGATSLVRRCVEACRGAAARVWRVLVRADRYDLAAALLRPEGQDYVWEDLQALRRKLFKTGSTDSVLRQWSQGIVGDKTFQQISEEFAGIVIPKVWKREGRKVSRVAARLSISPKKVRRILANAGLMENKTRAED